MPSTEQPKPGLRERKKIKTRDTIQQHALRLFRKQGYHETTVEQIADAAEISPSTFFRYFPTKEALLLEDDYDPLLIRAFREQPNDLTPIQALRRAIKTGLSAIPEEGLEALRERMALIMSVPELRAASLSQLMSSVQLIADLVAERIGRPAGDLYAVTLAGSAAGALMAIQTYLHAHPEANFIELFDQALAQMESGHLPPR